MPSDAEHSSFDIPQVSVFTDSFQIILFEGKCREAGSILTVGKSRKSALAYGILTENVPNSKEQFTNVSLRATEFIKSFQRDVNKKM